MNANERDVQYHLKHHTLYIHDNHHISQYISQYTSHQFMRNHVRVLLCTILPVMLTNLSGDLVACCCQQQKSDNDDNSDETDDVTLLSRQARELLRVIQSHYLSRLVDAQVDGQAIDPPKCLEWSVSAMDDRCDAWCAVIKYINVHACACICTQTCAHVHAYMLV